MEKSYLKSSRNFFEHGNGQSLIIKLPYVICAILVGLLSVGFAKVSEQATELFVEIMRVSPYWGLLITPLAFTLSRWLVMAHAPAAGGSGIPQVMAALEQKLAAILLRSRGGQGEPLRFRESETAAAF